MLYFNKVENPPATITEAPMYKPFRVSKESFLRSPIPVIKTGVLMTTGVTELVKSKKVPSRFLFLFTLISRSKSMSQF